MGSGSLAQMKKRLSERGFGANNKLEFRSEEGEALIRILTDANLGKDERSLGELYANPIHSIPRVSQRNKKYNEEIPCRLEKFGECVLCDREIAKKEKMYLWVWVYSTKHSKPDNDGKWAKKKDKAGNIFYVEEVNAPKLLVTGRGVNDSTLTQFMNSLVEYDTLCDRDHKWKRTGLTMTDTNYSLMSVGSPSPLSKEQQEAKNNLPDLEDYILGEEKKIKDVDIKEEKEEKIDEGVFGDDDGEDLF